MNTRHLLSICAITVCALAGAAQGLTADPEQAPHAVPPISSMQPNQAEAPQTVQTVTVSAKRLTSAERAAILKQDGEALARAHREGRDDAAS